MVEEPEMGEESVKVEVRIRDDGRLSGVRSMGGGRPIEEREPSASQVRTW
jgi:hypothetical protein